DLVSRLPPRWYVISREISLGAWQVVIAVVFHHNFKISTEILEVQDLVSRLPPRWHVISREISLGAWQVVIAVGGAVQHQTLSCM
ncbi:hypothetical protein J6590_100225, partial [Homalodisca vitripennis]